MHARSHYASHMEVSPSGEWLAFRENYHVYVVPMPPGGQVELSLKTKAVPQRRASDIGGDYLDWIDGDTLTWTLGPALYRAEMAELFATRQPNARGSRTKQGERSRTSASREPADKPRGVVALTGARIVTMNDATQVIENGVIVMRDNRIAAVGAAAPCRFRRTRNGWISRAARSCPGSSTFMRMGRRA